MSSPARRRSSAREAGNPLDSPGRRISIDPAKLVRMDKFSSH